MSEEKKTIEISEELYQAVQQLKGVFGQMTGKEIESDEEALGILVGGFIDSLNQEQGQEGQQGGEESGNQQGGENIIT